MRLSLKISSLAIILTVLITSTLSFIVYNLTERNLETSIEQNQLQQAKSTMQSIDRELYERYQDIEDIGGSVIFRKYIKKEASRADMLDRFNSCMVSTGPWDILELFSGDGTLIFSSKEKWTAGEKNKDDEEKKAFETAMGGQIYVSDLVVSGTSGNPTVYYASPIVDTSVADKPIIGVTIGQLSWMEVEMIISGVENSGNFRVRLLNKNLEVIAEDGDRSHLFKRITDFDNTNLFLNDVGVYRGGQSDYLVSNVLQNGYLDFKGSGWRLLADTPTSTAFAAASMSSRNIVQISTLIMFIEVLILLAFLSHVLIKPILKLQITAKEIASGKLNERAEVLSKDEIGLLAQSFNEMTDKLLETARFPESIISQMADSLIVLTSDKKIRMINKSALNLLGFKEGELIGKKVDEIMACQIDEKGTVTSCLGIDQLVREGAIKEKNEKTNFKTKSGELIPVSISGSTLGNNKNGNTDIIIVAKDLREMQRLEKEKLEILEQSSKEMEEKIKERTMNLDAANQQLLSSNQQLETANQELAAAQRQMVGKVNELERFNKITMGREAKILELKSEVSRLKRLKSGKV
jgi:PAS domain S-box-containing protein